MTSTVKSDEQEAADRELLRHAIEALRPFAAKADGYPANSTIFVHDDVELWQLEANKGLSLNDLGWTVGDLRKARAVLAEYDKKEQRYG